MRTKRVCIKTWRSMRDELVRICPTFASDPALYVQVRSRPTMNDQRPPQRYGGLAVRLRRPAIHRIWPAVRHIGPAIHFKKPAISGVRRALRHAGPAAQSGRAATRFGRPAPSMLRRAIPRSRLAQGHERNSEEAARQPTESRGQAPRIRVAVRKLWRTPPPHQEVGSQWPGVRLI